MAHGLLKPGVSTHSEGVFSMENNQNVQSPGTPEVVNRDKIKADVMGVVDKAKTAGREQLESGKHAAASQAAKVATVIEESSSQLKENNLQPLADYASELGTTIKKFSEGLHNRSVDDLVTDVREMARRNPAVFLLVSVAIGIGVSRFLKASAHREHETNFEDSEIANESSGEAK